MQRQLCGQDKQDRILQLSPFMQWRDNTGPTHNSTLYSLELSDGNNIVKCDIMVFNPFIFVGLTITYEN